MNIKPVYFLLLIMPFYLKGSVVFSQAVDPVAYVNPFIGTEGGGNTFPGATLPFGVVSVSPDTKPPQKTSGYTSGQPIVGFSHVHTSGTGGSGRYGNFPIFPQNGEFDNEINEADAVYEKATPGYYTAQLSHDVLAEMTLTKHVGFHKYTFKANTAALKMDISRARRNRPENSRAFYKCNFAEVMKLSDYRICGFMDAQGGWGGINPHRTYFMAEFDHPISSFSVSGHTQHMGTDYLITFDKTDLACFLSFDLDKSKELKAKVSISYHSYEKAEYFLNEIPDWDFDRVKQESEETWRNFLSKIEIPNGDRDYLMILYSGMYHAAIMPRDLSEDQPLWQSEKPHFWDFYCIWDTFRSQNPLLMLIAPEMQGKMVAGLLDIYENEGWLPDAWTAGYYGVLQGGTNADIVISEAIQKNVQGFNYDLAWEAVLKNANVPTIQNNKKEPRYGREVLKYDKYGYLPSSTIDGGETPGCPVSRSLEYAYNDFAIAMIAKKLGKTQAYENFLKRSDRAFNLFNPETKFFWARDTKGKWLDGFDPDLHNRPWQGPYYEGTPWQYSMSTPHNIQKLINLHGGKEAFMTFLDRIFDDGHYTQGNQPDIHMPWLYHYAGRPDKSSQRTNDLLDKEYGVDRKGLPGNDDAGTMSAWAVLASIGMYPVPGQDIYLLTAPLFEEVTIDLGNSKNLKIIKNGGSAENKHIMEVRLNGRTLKRYWLRHAEIAEGGILELVMGIQPLWENAKNVPPSFDQI